MCRTIAFFFQVIVLLYLLIYLRSICFTEKLFIYIDSFLPFPVFGDHQDQLQVVTTNAEFIT